MTPIEYGLIAFWITLGVVAPIIIMFSIRSCYEWTVESIQCRESCYRRYMNPKYWFVRKVEQAPNPDYIQVYMENSACYYTLRTQR